MQRCQGIARKRRGRGERQTTPGSARSRRNGARFSLFPLKSHPNHPLTTSPASNWTPVCLGNHTADVTPSAGGGMSVSGWPVNVSPSDWEEAADGGEEKKGGALMVVHTFSCGPGLARAHERRRGGGPKRRRGVHVSRALLAMRDFFFGGVRPKHAATAFLCPRFHSQRASRNHRCGALASWEAAVRRGGGPRTQRARVHFKAQGWSIAPTPRALPRLTDARGRQGDHRHDQDASRHLEGKTGGKDGRDDARRESKKRCEASFGPPWRGARLFFWPPPRRDPPFFFFSKKKPMLQGCKKGLGKKEKEKRKRHAEEGRRRNQGTRSKSRERRRGGRRQPRSPVSYHSTLKLLVSQNFIRCGRSPLDSEKGVAR
jgi:hypothetical protein